MADEGVVELLDAAVEAARAAGRDCAGWTMQSDEDGYVVHNNLGYVYLLLGIGFRQGTGYGMLYAGWAAGLLILYFACRWYRDLLAAAGASTAPVVPVG